MKMLTGNDDRVDVLCNRAQFFLEVVQKLFFELIQLLISSYRLQPVKIVKPVFN
jgi:hypothetical protein